MVFTQHLFTTIKPIQLHGGATAFMNFCCLVGVSKPFSLTFECSIQPQMKKVCGKPLIPSVGWLFRDSHFNSLTKTHQAQLVYMG